MSAWPEGDPSAGLCTCANLLRGLQVIQGITQPEVLVSVNSMCVDSIAWHFAGTEAHNIKVRFESMKLCGGVYLALN